MVSMESCPLSTKSPKNKYHFYGIDPPVLNSYKRSKNYPWISPHIMTGEFMYIMLG